MATEDRKSSIENREGNFHKRKKCREFYIQYICDKILNLILNIHYQNCNWIWSLFKKMHNKIFKIEIKFCNSINISMLFSFVQKIQRQGLHNNLILRYIFFLKYLTSSGKIILIAYSRKYRHDESEIILAKFINRKCTPNS